MSSRPSISPICRTNPFTCRVMYGQNALSLCREILRPRAIRHLCNAPFGNRRLLNGMAIKTTKPSDVRRPFEYHSESASRFVSAPSSITPSCCTPEGLLANTYACRPSRKVSRYTVTWSSPEMSSRGIR